MRPQDKPYWNSKSIHLSHNIRIRLVLLKKKLCPDLVQYSDRTVASTEKKYTSTESSVNKDFADGKSKGVALSEGLHTHLL